MCEKVKRATIIGNDKQVDFTNKDKDTNWLRDETSKDNIFVYDASDSGSQGETTTAEVVAWDSKIRLAYASPADKFRDNKETA